MMPSCATLADSALSRSLEVCRSCRSQIVRTRDRDRALLQLVGNAYLAERWLPQRELHHRLFNSWVGAIEYSDTRGNL